MENKKGYEKPSVIVIPLEIEDIITCSGVGTNIFDGNGTIKDIWKF